MAAAAVERHNEVLAAAMKRAAALEPRLADLLEPILERAGQTAASAFRRYATDHLTASGLGLVAAADDVAPTSTMIAVKPRADEAARIAVAGMPAERLHVTLAYLGQVDGDLEAVAEALRPVAAAHGPLAGEVGGAGLFGRPDQPGPTILLPDTPGLAELRVAATEALQQAGIDYGREHGFQPHVTIDYRGESEEAQEPYSSFGEPLHFDSLLVVRGDKIEYEIPLVGVPPLTAAAGQPPPWSAPFPDEIIDVDALVARIRAKTDPVRQAMVAATMTPLLREAGLSWSVTNPFAGKVLAGAGAKVTDIARTTQLNVMRIIRASYENGLSIPQTATAIQVGMSSASRARATMIARTELVGAANGASLAATQIVADATGSAYRKRWLTAPGAPHPRHELYDGLDGQTVGLDATFDVGGSPLQHPGDPDGDPGEVINCRCTMIYAEGGGDASGGDEGGDVGDEGGDEAAQPAEEEDVGGLADGMVEDAAAAEPATTAALSSIAEDAGGEMVGLDYAVKTPSSLERKIAGDLAVARKTNPAATAAEVAGRINDSLRYTMQFDPADYGPGVERATAALRSAGYEQVKMKNYWGNLDYQGINSVYRSATGTRLELQFHTPQSFDLKGSLHTQYDAYRSSADAAERTRLWDEMAAAQSRVEPPPGALSFGDPVRHYPGVQAELGVTPFRAGEDNVLGFYDSDKYGRFLDDVRASAADYGVEVDGLDRVTGVWQGETEPSVSLRVHDGELGVRAYAANLGQAYDQDGVLLFGAQRGGDVMATFERAVPQGEASAAMARAGVDGGRFTADGRLQVIGSGPGFVAQLDKIAADLGMRYEPAVGSFEILERDAGGYKDALAAFARAQR